MSRKISALAPGWWDFTTLDQSIIEEAAALTPEALLKLSRPGFTVTFHDSLEDFYCAQALEYIDAWRQATPDNPTGICGPIGPTEQLPLVARIVNAMDLKLHNAHFWGMDEWIIDGKVPTVDHPLSFERCDRELCFDRIRPELVMPDSNLHFPSENHEVFEKTWDSGIRCVVMQGGQGDVKHWAFNDPLPRTGAYTDAPPSPEEYRKLKTRIVDLHPVTIAQNARTSGGGNISLVPTRAVTVGPRETWLSDRVSIWQAGVHDNPFGQRLTALMISKRYMDTSVPMSLLADHPDVQFHYYRGGIGTCAVEMH
jgi:glucosamine-6-phosphate deaminase